MMKKYLLLVATVALGFPALASAATCPLLTDTAYKTPAGPGVFYILSDCTKRLFPDRETYLQFFSSYRTIRKTTTAVLKRIPNNTRLFLTVEDKKTIKPAPVKPVVKIAPVPKVKPWVMTATVSSTAHLGQTLPIYANFTAPALGNYYLIDITVYNSKNEQVDFYFYDKEPFTDVATRHYTFYWKIKSTLPPGNYTVRLGVQLPHWGTSQGWNDHAAYFTILP